MRDKLLSVERIGLILALAEYDVPADGVGMRVYRPSRAGSVRIRVDAHLAEVGAKVGLHVLPGSAIQRTPRGAKRIANVARCTMTGRRRIARAALHRHVTSGGFFVSIMQRRMDGG